MGLITLFSHNYVVVSKADIYITAGARQQYSSSSRAWQMSIWFAGVVAKTASGQGGFTDSVSMLLGIVNVNPGTYLVELRWTAETPLTLVAPSMVIQSSYK